jgi:HEAT repeat protein
LKAFQQITGQDLQAFTTDQALLKLIQQSITKQNADAPVPGADTGDIASQVKANVNRLNSTQPITIQSFGKARLIKLGAQAVPYLEDYLANDKRTYVRVQIARILGKIGDVSAIPSLEEAAKSEFNSLNKTAITALGDIGGENALQSLERLNSTTRDQECLQAIMLSENKIKDAKK